jgi:glycogen synthase
MSATRVLHVLDHSLPLLSGYSTRSHHALRAQLEWQLAPTVVTSPKHGPASGSECIDGITYFRTPTKPNGLGSRVPGAGELQLMQRLATRVAQVAREQGSQIVHAHSPVLNGLPALWVARRAGLPIVYEIRAFWEDAGVDHGTHRENSVRYRAIRALETFLMRRADAVGVISKGLAAEVERRGVAAAKIFQIPNGVDTTLFRPMPRDPELTARWGLDGCVVIGFIGSFYRYEGLDGLLEAWAKVFADVPEARVLLIGAGETVAPLREQAARLGVESRTIFAGSVPHSEVARCYSVCDVMVYPRKPMRLTHLVTPLKPLEAMAAGKAVIASDVGGLRELIRDGDTGVLFRAGDPDALADTLRSVVRSADLRSTLGEAGRRAVCAERQWKTLVRVHVETYARLVNGAHASAA